jgi:formylglycine-generating enzyme required for sulfatase activity
MSCIGNQTLIKIGFFVALLAMIILLGCPGGEGGGSDGDDDDGDPKPLPYYTYYEDADGDGYGDSEISLNATSQPDGYVSNNHDCDDTNPNVHPASEEICGDGIDQDCSGTDLKCPIDPNEVDDDGDGFTENQGDCDDNNDSIYPSATEICDDGVDQDCDGSDLTCSSSATYYRDADGDNYGDPNNSVDASSQPEGYTKNNTDCDDNNDIINPGATEVCGDGIDQDCSGADLNCSPPITTYYLDNDKDGYGDPNTAQEATSEPSGFVSNNSDCDDSNDNVYPGAEEICNDRIDQNCDSNVDEDCSTLVDNQEMTFLMGSNGGQIELLDAEDESYNLKLSFLPETLSKTSLIKITSDQDVPFPMPSGADGFASKMYQIELNNEEHNVFQKPFKLELPILSGINTATSEVYMAYWNDNDWVRIGSYLSDDKSRIVAEIDHLTVFMLFMESNQDSSFLPQRYLEVPYYGQGLEVPWCFFACAAMLLKSTGIEIETYEIANLFSTQYRDGNMTTAEGVETSEYDVLESFLEDISLSVVEYIRWSSGIFEKQKYKQNYKNYIKNQLSFSKPVITGLGIKGVGHAILIVGYDDNNVYIHDPSGSLIEHIDGSKDIDLEIRRAFYGISWDRFLNHIFDPFTELNSITYSFKDEESINSADSFYIPGTSFNDKYKYERYGLSFGDKENLDDKDILHSINFSWNSINNDFGYSYDLVEYSDLNNYYFYDNKFGYHANVNDLMHLGLKIANSRKTQSSNLSIRVTFYQLDDSNPSIETPYSLPDSIPLQHDIADPISPSTNLYNNIILYGNNKFWYSTDGELGELPLYIFELGNYKLHLELWNESEENNPRDEIDVYFSIGEGEIGLIDDDNDNVPNDHDLCPETDIGEIAELINGCPPLKFWYRDFDDDRFGDPDEFIEAWEQPDGYVDNDDDWDDEDPDTYPGAPELCHDGKDNNRDGHIDEDCIDDPNVFINKFGMAFKLIMPGTFTMGSPPDELGRRGDETQHEITLTHPFYMQITEVTQGQWEALMGTNPAYFSSCGNDCPVELVSWEDAQNFISTLNEFGEGTYRLPTEAEWEYTARSGSTTAFANGDISVTDCNYDDSLDTMAWYCYNSESTTHPVAQKDSNLWGLYDMHGNVWEWVQDRYGTYLSSPLIDPSGPDSGSYRVNRGCCWADDADFCRSAARWYWEPDVPFPYTGLRLVREAENCTDFDIDGFFSEGDCGTQIDCDDSDADIYPNAPEKCDGKDNQCQGDNGYGSVDEECWTIQSMALIPAGCFEMGNASSSSLGYSNELPVHNVCITSDFYVDVHEVTNAEYSACVSAGECTAPESSTSLMKASYYGNPAYDDYPVIYVNWYQANDYCNWADKRLPTEAEWEYAARGGLSGMPYPWGNYGSTTKANYWYADGPWDNDTSPVESYAANGYGLYDVSGNVWEWVHDRYQSNYYSVSPTNNPPGPASGTDRVLRGGGWYYSVRDQRLATRKFASPTYQHFDIGFRCADEANDCTDIDDDGFFSEGDCGTQIDCDDSDADIYPNAPEKCDGKDNQCQGDVGYGEVDEGGVCGVLPSDISEFVGTYEGIIVIDEVDYQFSITISNPEGGPSGVDSGLGIYWFNVSATRIITGTELEQTNKFTHAFTITLGAQSYEDGTISSAFVYSGDDSVSIYGMMVGDGHMQLDYNEKYDGEHYSGEGILQKQ